MNRIIVSLTSYPARISSVDRTVKTLLIQNRKADRIILWLAEEQFPQKEDELPAKLLELKEYGLEIRWCDDLKPHKKYFYAMQEFPEDIIITVDDDVYYSPRLIEALVNSYGKNPRAVSCAVTNRIRISEGEFGKYESWPHNDKLFQGIPQMDIMPVGIGGVLYPPGILPKETFDKEAIKNLCLNQDDLWLKAMELKEGVPTVLVEENLPYPEVIVEAQAVGLYLNLNQDENDKAIGRIAEFLDNREKENRFLINRILGSKLQSDESSSENHFSNEFDRKLFEKLKNGFFIYGAGIGAGMVMECLQSIDSSLLPKAFLVTSMEGNDKELFGCPVKEISDTISGLSDLPIIISAGEKKHDAIIETLDKYQTGEQLFIRDAIMGKILHGKREISVSTEMFAYSLLGKE